MGNIQFDKSLILLEIIILRVVLLPFLAEKFEGLHLVFFLMVSAPIFNDFDDPIWHGEGGDCMGFSKNTHVDVKYLVYALVIARGTKEYARECEKVHSVGNGWIIVDFDIGSKGGLAVFLEIKFVAKDSLAGGVFVRYPGSRWENI
jgi:hypothetical protein